MIPGSPPSEIVSPLVREMFAYFYYALSLDRVFGSPSEVSSITLNPLQTLLRPAKLLT